MDIIRQKLTKITETDKKKTATDRKNDKNEQKRTETKTNRQQGGGFISGEEERKTFHGHCDLWTESAQAPLW